MEKAADQTEWTEMYDYYSDPYTDLLAVVTEFLKECEYAGHVASCPEVSSTVIDDIETWKKRRKELLVADFAEYLKAQS